MPFVEISGDDLRVVRPARGSLGKAAALLIDRSQVIVLRLDAMEPPAVEAEIRRQLPPEFSRAARALADAQVLIWPPVARHRAEALFRKRGVRLAGVALDAGLSSGRGPRWIVPPRRLNGAAVEAWAAAHRRSLGAAAGLLVAAGLLLGSRTSARQDLVRDAERDLRRHAADTNADVHPDSHAAALDAIAIVPANAHLLELSVVDGSALRLRGRARDYATASAIHAALASLPRLADVKPGRSGLVQVGRTSVVEFFLEARVR